jgi:hypothetical protein
MLELMSTMSPISLILFYFFLVITLAVIASISVTFVVKRMTRKLDVIVAGTSAILEAMLGVEHRCPLADGAPTSDLKSVAAMMNDGSISVKVRRVKDPKGQE